MYLYTSYEWLLFCEIKSRCEGADPQQAIENNPVAHPMESASSEVKTYKRIIKSVEIELLCFGGKSDVAQEVSQVRETCVTLSDSILS